MKKIQIMLMCLCFFIAFSGCSQGEESGGTFTLCLQENPANLDPQMAEDTASLTVIRNIYQTLMEFDESGMVVCSGAKSYDISGDGLTYTFTLRDDLHWSDASLETDVPLTAHDYVYAMRRIYSPETHSPHTELFSDIKNSASCLKGAPLEELGIYAPDDHTVVIELSAADCDFLKLMAHPASSPCNRELFESTEGRYGLSVKDTFSCGAFRLSEWNYDPYWTENFITLTKIRSNSSEDFFTYPDEINIRIGDDKAQPCAYMTNTCPEETGKKNVDSCECSLSVLLVSPDSVFYTDAAKREALFGAADEDFTELLEEGSARAYSFIPSYYTVMNKPYGELYPKGDKIPRSSRFEADEGFPTLLVCDDYPCEKIPYAISDALEETGYYCAVTFESRSSYQKSFEEGKYDLCIYTVSSQQNDTLSVLSALADVCPLFDKRRLSDPRVRKGNILDKAAFTKSMEELLLTESYALPLTFDSTWTVTDKDVEGAVFDPLDGTIYCKYLRNK